jgi:hypothetical protein
VFVDARLKEAEMRRCRVIRVDAQPHDKNPRDHIMDGVTAPDSFIHLPLSSSGFSIYTKLKHAMMR